jgi:3-oxoadipate enol-lactonase
MAARLAFDDLGQGPAVILVHGHPFNRSMWAPQHDALLAAGFRIVSPDLRGYGESAATAGMVTMRVHAEDILLLLDRLGIGSFAVVGLSMGGLVTMELALAQPQGVWAVGLVATTAEPVTAEERSERLAMAEELESKGMEPLVGAMSKRLYGPHCPEAVVTYVDRMMRENNPLGAAAALRGRAHRPDYREQLSAIDVPTLVCVGSADTWSTAEVTQQLVACLRAPHSVIIPDVGHLPNLEAPELFNDTLVDFLLEADEPRRQAAVGGAPPD